MPLNDFAELGTKHVADAPTRNQLGKLMQLLAGISDQLNFVATERCAGHTSYPATMHVLPMEHPVRPEEEPGRRMGKPEEIAAAVI